MEDTTRIPKGHVEDLTYLEPRHLAFEILNAPLRKIATMATPDLRNDIIRVGCAAAIPVATPVITHFIARDYPNLAHPHLGSGSTSGSQGQCMDPDRFVTYLAWPRDRAFPTGGGEATDVVVGATILQ
ncbi:hypothetical protein RJT34_16662 [Clitoria ternatea]|uniref:Uncharacterized protein n=1 Tax=Clitoria ternatea TaxID=43366 RepID=A0AAN9J9M0_CLITE